MVNAWGMALEDQSKAFWIADNSSGKISIVDATGAPVALKTSTRNPDGTLVKIDVGEGVSGAAKNPSATAFLMMQPGQACEPAKVLFANEGGQIVAVNDDIDPAKGMVMVDRSDQMAVYKGIAIIAIPGTPDATGKAVPTMRILAPDFHNARIDVFDENFKLVTAPATLPTTGAATTMFVNPALPATYAPFNVVAINDKVYVAYAVQDDMKHDDSPGAGLGMVDEFDLQGNFIRTLAAAGGPLNAPWGIALAPSDFCNSTAGSLLVGNFGDGHITSIDLASGRVIGQVADTKGAALAVDGLWSIGFGDGIVGATNHLYFTAGPAEESHGLFGYLKPQQ
jgi:uncharacterized protein (TIGR03118 family)